MASDFDLPRLRRRMNRCLPLCKAWSGIICRAVGSKYANESDLISGAGSKTHGARWTPKGTFDAIYGSLDPFVALSETLGTYGHYGVPFAERLPLVLVAIDVTLQVVLDLTDSLIRKRLAVSEKKIVECNWEVSQRDGREALTQAIGRVAWELEIEGLIVPSARFRNERNIMIVPDRLRADSSLSVQKLTDLPQTRDE